MSRVVLAGFAVSCKCVVRVLRQWGHPALSWSDDPASFDPLALHSLVVGVFLGRGQWVFVVSLLVVLLVSVGAVS